MSDIVERLRAKWQVAPVLGGGSLNGPCYIRDDGMRLRNPDGPEAAETILALRTAIKEAEIHIDCASFRKAQDILRASLPPHQGAGKP